MLSLLGAGLALLLTHCSDPSPNPQEPGWSTPVLIDAATEVPTASNGSPDVEFDPASGAATVTVLWYRFAEIHFAGSEISNWTSRHLPEAGWQAPVRIPAADDIPRAAKLAVLGDGGLLAVWQGFLSGQVYASRARPQQGWEEPLLLAPYPENGFVLVPDGLGNAALFWLFLDAEAVFPLPPDRLLWRRYDTGSGWMPQAHVAAMSQYASTAMFHAAFHEGGQGLVVWDEYATDTADRYDLGFSLYSPQTGWSARRLVGASYTRDGETGPAGLAVDASGDTLLVWSRTDGLFVKRHSRGTGWESGAVRLGTVRALRAHVGADGLGNAVVAWLQDEPTGQRRRVYVSRYEPAGGWGEPVEMRSPGPYAIQAALAVAPQGRVFVAWTDASTPIGEGTGPVWASSFEPASGWKEPIRLQDQAAQVDVACDREGRAIAAWTSDGRVWASRFE
jgi:hypothetical protein